MKYKLIKDEVFKSLLNNVYDTQKWRTSFIKEMSVNVEYDLRTYLWGRLNAESRQLRGIFNEI